MKKAKLFLSAFLVLIFAAASAQNIRVSGIVTDQDGNPLIGATVMLQGNATVGTSTGVDGSYSLNVSPNGTLVATMIGYAEQVVPVNNQRNINFVLQEDSEFLDNAVVVGYGSAKKIGTIVGSVTTVKSETVKNTPSASALDALQGQVAGLAVLTTGGVSGDNNVSMTLHGMGSLGASSTPLFIIDGIPSSSSAVMNMNPNDIESVSVLKDASATSIYGSRAANGVVYVQTKSGSYNETASVTIRSQWGTSTVADMTYYNNLMSSDELKDFWVRSGIFTPEYIYNNYTSRGYNHNTKWYEHYMQFNNPQSQNDITIEGGGRKVAYMLSASQYYQRGTTPGNYYERYTVRSNVQGHPFEWLKVGLTSNLTKDQTQSNGYYGSSSSAGGNNYLYGGLSIILNPLYPDEFDPNAYGRYLGSGYRDTHIERQNNPRVYDSYNLSGSAYVEIEPIHNLKFISRIGTDSYFQLYQAYNTPSYYANNGTGSRSRRDYMGSTNTITNTIEYSFDIGKNNINLLAGQEGTAYTYDTWGASGSNNNANDRQLLLNQMTQSTYSMSESWSEYKFLSFFGHADYSYDGKYIADFTLRRDSSSRFGKDNRSANFWSVGLMWKLKKENFLRNVRAVNDLNFKVSYGTQGNAAIGNYTSLGLIGSGTYAESPTWGLSQPANTSLSWESQGLFTVALTGRLWNRVNFDFEYYNRQTKDMLMGVPYPYTAGFGVDDNEQYDNVGSLSNSGLDLTLGIDILRGRDHYLTFNATFNYNKEVVTELFNDMEKWTVPNTGITYKVGQPVSFYYPIFAGVDPTDGAPTWYLPTGWEEYQASVAAGEPDVDLIDITTPRMDPDATTKDFNEDLLMQNTGKKRNAPINGGFGLAGGWKNLSFRADFAYVLGKYLINNDAYFYLNPNVFPGYNQSKAVTDFWTPTNTDARFPDWSQGYETQFDTSLLEKASFLRLKTLQVGYRLPAGWLGWQKVVKGIQFTFTGRNLFTLTKYMGTDPEVNSNLVLGLPGNTKQLLGGVEITF